VPLLQQVLHTVPPSLSDWGVIAACSLLPVVVVELLKLMQRVVARPYQSLRFGQESRIKRERNSCN